jgi:hypothetical protein
MRFLTTVSAGSLAAAFALAACSDSPSTPDNPSVPAAVAQAQVEEVGAAALDDADESLASVLDQIGGGMMGLTNPSPCPSITSTFTNDPVPAYTARVQFGTLPEATTPWPPSADDPCLRTGDGGWRDRDHMGHMGGDLTMKVYLFGLLEKTVAGTRDADFERSETATDLGWVRSVDDFTDFVRMQRNGTRRFSRTAAGVLASEDMVTARQRKLGGLDLQSTITAELDWSFVPVEGSTLVSREARPSGSITVTGSHRFVGEIPVRATDGSITVTDVDAAHGVQTITPLFYDSSCTQVMPRRRIASGQLLFSRTNGTTARSFTITWSGCGVEPVRAEVPAS